MSQKKLRKREVVSGHCVFKIKDSGKKCRGIWDYEKPEAEGLEFVSLKIVEKGNRKEEAGGKRRLNSVSLDFMPFF